MKENAVPIYEYRCRKCHEVTERIQGVKDPPLRKCPSCGGKLEKMMSPGAFVLKGTGWYATDYANEGNSSGKGDGRGKDEAKAPACAVSGDPASPACSGCPKVE